MGHNDKDPKDTGIPNVLEQNPAPFPGTGQDHINKVRAKTDEIMAQFLRVLPSNYVSQVSGPWYTLQFQALAERLAEFQCTAQEVFKDSDFDFTRSEFLWQVIGALVFPTASESLGGAPDVNGDTEYRSFLHRMILLLLEGATPDANEEGAGLLTSADVALLEKFLGTRLQGGQSAWDLDDQFTFEVNVEYEGGTSFPVEDPFVLQENVRLILQALKPAHAIFEYRHLFRDAFGELFSDDDRWEMRSYYYDDLRKYCLGAKEIVGVDGETLPSRTLFSDPNRSFQSISPGASLVITTGVNAGTYQVAEVVFFPTGDDTAARAYTTSPTGLTGSATVSGEDIVDPGQDFSQAVEGEILTFSEGPNSGSYRLGTLLGSNGGPVGSPLAAGPATGVRITPSILRVRSRMPEASTGQAYRVSVDRLGESTPNPITGEDASAQFYL